MDWQTPEDSFPTDFITDAQLRAIIGRPPISGAWRDGDPVGEREFVRIGTVNTEAGERIPHVRIAYESFGRLNAARDNAVLVFHALTGDSHLVGHAAPGHPTDGWWSEIVGPGKALDTDRYFVVAPNVLGGCQGSTGPASLDPDGREWGGRFPYLTIRDQVTAAAAFADAIGIERFAAVIGGSMGGMQVLQWAASYPARVFSALPLATGAKHSAQNIAFHEVGRQAVMADPEWRRGRYLEEGTRPAKGLSVARMGAHITYLSEQALHRKFGRKLQDREAPTFSFDADFQVESYLRHQGLSFVERFDANSYLYVTRAMDYFDLAADHDGVLARAFTGTKTRFCVASFTSDWLFPTSDSRAIVHALNAAGASVSFVELESDKGHDAFLLEEPNLFATTRGFIGAAARARGL